MAKDKIERVMGLLRKAYGRPAPLGRSKPVNELVRTILSQNTNDRNSLAAFKVLKDNFNSWDEAAKAGTKRIERLIRHAGLARIKAERIKEALGTIKGREGRITLSRLRKMPIRDSLDYLRSIKGVGPKTAACVLLFSFGKPVMPVDTHIFRVTKRLGLIDDGMDIETAHAVLARMVPKGLTPRLRSGSSPEQARSKATSASMGLTPRLRSGSSPEQARSKATSASMDLIYEFHLGIIEHGRRTCRAQHPRCGECVLYGLCNFKDRTKYLSVKSECRNPKSETNPNDRNSKSQTI